MSRKDSGEPVWGQGELDLGRVPVGRAKICLLPESGQGLTGSVQGSGVNTSEPFAHFDHDTSSWRTSQVCLLTRTWDVYSETWPRAGTMRNGIVYQQVPLAPLTGGIGYGLWPTPKATEYKGGHSSKGGPSLGMMATHNLWPTPTLNTVSGGANDQAPTVKQGRHGLNLSGAVRLWPTPDAHCWKGSGPTLIRSDGKDRSWDRLDYATEQVTDKGGGQLNPQWVEWLMGYPIGWTDLEDSATR